MNFRISIMKFSMLVLIFGCVTAQEYYEEENKIHYKPHLKTIPKKFEFKAHNAKSEFARYATEIGNLAKKENVSIIYKVKVEILKPQVAKKFKKTVFKKGHSKTFNVPLKKNSMKRSNFEVYMRRMAEENTHNQQNNDMYSLMTTERQRIQSTRITKLKFKPALSRLKTNYTKIVRPVRNKIITLTV